MKTLSVVLITRQTEARLEEVLKSSFIADEIVLVIDTNKVNSKSEKTGKKYRAKIFLRLMDNYADQKNFGIAKSKGDWILSIDADEVISKRLQQEIFTVIRDKSFYGYFIPIRNYLGGKWLRFGGLYPDYHLRLFKRGSGRFIGSVHEKLNLKKNIGYLKNPLLHYTYKDLSEYRQKVISYAIKEAELSVKNGLQFYWFDHIKILFRFIKLYFFKFGFLDGFYGLASAFLLSYYLWVKFNRVRELRKK